jgi:hypothetical protein
MPMSTLDSNFDSQMSALELEWRQVYEASIVARAHYRALMQNNSAKEALLRIAKERLDQAEASNARIMAKIERLERKILRGLET